MSVGRLVPLVARAAVVCVAAFAHVPASSARAAIASPQPAPRVIDTFDSVDGWSARPADGVEMKLSTDAGVRGRALRVDFRFVKGGGYAVLHRDLALELPENYRFTFELRGECPNNNFEFKLIDSTGSNVWWCNRRDFAFPREWQTVSTRRRQIEFAWGPAGGGEIRHVAAIEIAVTAGSGGAGTIWLDDLELTALPPPSASPPAVIVRASSSAPGHGPEQAADGDTATFWQSAPGDTMPWLMLDLQEEREYGGLVIDWTPLLARGASGRPVDYVVEISSDSVSWRTVREVRDGQRARDYLYLPESESRFIRVRPTLFGSACAVREIALRPVEWSATRETFFQALAKDAPRGSFPRGMSGEQVYWTVVSVDGGARKGLMSEDGAIETGKGSFSIEPFLYVDGKLLTWADVKSEASLVEGDLPLPSVRWSAADLELTITAYPFDPPDSSSILASYIVANHAARRRRVTLDLVLRPFQVNPPAQFLNMPGGTAPIREIVREDQVIRVNGDREVISLTPASRFCATTFDRLDLMERLRAGRLSGPTHVEDLFGAASGTLAYDLEPPPRGEQEVDLLVPLHRFPARDLAELSSPAWPGAPAGQRIRWLKRLSRDRWAAGLQGVRIEIPYGDSLSGVGPVLRSQLGWILASRAGAALQPGTRSYARAWIRDGALISSALLRLGQPEPVREFIEWFAPYQYDDGKVPCCVDQRGSDPVPEHDSSGELIFLIAEYYRYTGDRALVERLWPRVRAAAGYLDSLRGQRRTPEWRAPGKEEFFGLLPPSISHEGYSAKPMHSYWDDFFALRGFKDAAYVAGVLGRADEARRLGAIRDTFARDLGASIAVAMATHKIDYVPGAADLGDFDATSTAIALDPAQAQDILPPAAIEHTFERYWKFFADRRDGREQWEAFTPYEMRTIGAFVRLGWRARAHEMLAYFLRYCRPQGWNQWPEVVWHDERAPKFLGDLPHAWVAAEYIRSVLDLFAYERESDHSLVVGAGVPMRWVERGPGVAIRGLRTPYGTLNYTMKAVDGAVEVEIGGSLRIPPGGLAVHAPFDQPIRSATVAVHAAFDQRRPAKVNARAVTPNAAGEVVVRAVPARVVLRP